MAKRKSEIEVNHIAGNTYKVWADDGFVDKARKIEGIQEISPRKVDGAWTLWVDPRYDAAEVIAEIEALGLCASSPVAKHANKFPLDEYADNVGASLSARVDFPLTNLLPLCDAVETIMARIEAAIAEQSCDTDAQNWLWQVHARIDNRLHYGSWR